MSKPWRYQRESQAVRVGVGSRRTGNRRGDAVVRMLLAVGLLGLVGMMYGYVRRGETKMGSSYDGNALPRGDATQLVAVYIGSSTCHGSSLPGFVEVHDSTMLALAEYARSRGMTFTTIGVAVDNSPAVGRKYLQQIGRFDAVSIGGGWLNPLAVQYLWREFPAQGTIPQIVVLKRSITAAQEGTAVGPDSLLGRLVGISGMQRWLATQDKSE